MNTNNATGAEPTSVLHFPKSPEKINQAIDAVGMGAVLRSLSPEVKDRLWGLLSRIQESQEFERLGRPYTIDWDRLEVEMAGVCIELLSNCPTGDVWKVLTLLVVGGSGAIINLEGSGYDL